jgi:hypothetical protein
MLLAKKSIAANQYEETSARDEAIISLLAMKKNSQREIAAFKNSDNSVDTHLRASPNQVGLAFPFKPISGVSTNDVIGFAAAGSYQANGWNGVVEAFSFDGNATCTYSTMKINKVIIEIETAEYLVNGKPVGRAISGNKNTGFLYMLEWFTPERRMAIECATRYFDKGLMSKIIALANVVDKG